MKSPAQRTASSPRNSQKFALRMFQQKGSISPREYAYSWPLKGAKGTNHLHSWKFMYILSQPFSLYRFPTTDVKYIYKHIYICTSLYTHIYVFIHTPIYTHDSQVPSCSSDSSTALKFSHGMQILSALFSYTIACQKGKAAKWQSGLVIQCHTNIPTSDTGCCLYFLESMAFIWEINSEQCPRQWHVLFLLERTDGKCHEFGGKKWGKIKFKALTLYSSDLNDHVSTRQMTLSFILRLCLIK